MAQDKFVVEITTREGTSEDILESAIQDAYGDEALFISVVEYEEYQRGHRK